MKRIILLSAAMLFFALTLTSCFKTRVCECRSAIPGGNQNYDVGPGSKSKAKSDCENYEFNGKGSYPDLTCSLQ
jgi:hypothetical protein